ncbi:unnamed protein product [Nesidiocoris tenuis]|uniref:Sugar phosphate phosphatase n=1 Tax=Nesidiocoris tenuis TaxID=355587 RepID=A0A6H5GKK2_9HEMI|nr:unnamed protein product [Nesidiocoris tenuis]
MLSLQIQECLMKVLEDKEPPLNAPLAAKYRRSFAFPSMNERTPVILTKIIDYLARDKKNLIQKFGECSLWANRMDLSLSGGSTDVSIDVLEQVRNWDENILVNDSHYVTEILLQGSSPEVVDFVTDNGGVEVLHDMILADFILSRCGVRKIQFRLKPMPWYVSDVTPSDFHTTVNSLLNSNDEHLQYFGKRWQNFIDSGAWRLSSEDFWCLGLSYSEMPRVDPNLHEDLKASPLVIFKGDLNYRKLVQDRNWDTTTPFRLALGQFSDVTLLALRTCKADTIAGLKPDQAELTASKSSDWLVSGEYGLIQFNKGNCGAQ